MSNHDTDTGMDREPSPDGFGAMPSDLSENGAALERSDTAWTPGRLVVGKPYATGFMVEIAEEESPGRSYVVGRASPKYAAMFAAAPELYAELETLIGLAERVYDTIPSSYDENHPEVKAHAEAHNALGQYMIGRSGSGKNAARLALAKAKGGV